LDELDEVRRGWLARPHLTAHGQLGVGPTNPRVPVESDSTVPEPLLADGTLVRVDGIESILETLPDNNLEVGEVLRKLGISVTLELCKSGKTLGE
jgi:hypothetical protein